ncbi:Receptor for retinol uptake stra6 [Channa argus]|uniref:Receptor for retinol uptake STRA6 n=1 Tax=Channa argus TaxID=215402 RepID=A0A6G1P964_CHAAH|nr:Receptor for retinol uptake stra6 [Channa argus]
MNHSTFELDPFGYSYNDYSDWYSNNAEPTKPPKEIILPCDPTAEDKFFHICILSISLVVMLILAVLTRKNKFCQGFSRGSSSIFSPNNFLDQTQKKGLVMAVYGLMFSKLAVLVISPDPLPFSKDTSVDIKEYMKIIAIIYYPVLYYPLLVCSTLQRKAGYVFGALLSFCHFGVMVWQKFDCPTTPEIYKYYALLASLPQLACLAYLCVQFPLLFVRGPKTDETALLLVVLVVPTLHIVRAGIDENIAFLLMGFGVVLSDDRMEVVKIVTFYTWLLEVCYLCAVTLSCMVSIIMLMRSMILHRSNLKGLYKGDIYNLYNSLKTISPSKPGIVCWMGLTGYQAAIVCLGMAIQTVVFFICFLFLVFLIIIPVFYDRNIIVFTIAGKAWPVWVTLILATVLQHVTAKFAFIKKDAGTRDLNNRESLYLLTYLLFPINTLVGQIVAIWRMVITALYNIIHFGRIDISLLHRTAESYDPGIQENRPRKATSSRRIRSRWQVLYTLVNNPSLLGSRKHFQIRQTSDSILNGTPNHSSKKDSRKESSKPAAESAESTENPTDQENVD